jgi:hypothetical protein
MNKAGSSLTSKEDVDITYRKIAIGAGWQLYKQPATAAAFSNTIFSASTNYFD